MGLQVPETRIFLESGDPGETARAIELLGFLDGQVTCPPLMEQAADAILGREESRKMDLDQYVSFYRRNLGQISKLVPQGQVHFDLYAEPTTSAEEILTQARSMVNWIPNGVIAIPIYREGLAAAQQCVKEDLLPINLSMCFSQEQAAGAYTATTGAMPERVFLTVFIRALEKNGEAPWEIIERILGMLHEGDGHLGVITAGIGTIDHFMTALELAPYAVAAPVDVLRQWADRELYRPQKSSAGPKEKEYRGIHLTRNWSEYDISHPLTTNLLKTYSRHWSV
jgi:transaldolase